jgi:uncharacterized damage-inducible protein DinB
MSILSATRPEASEYAPYYHRYISLVPDGNIIQTLDQQCTSTIDLIAGISDDRANYRYAPGKWSVKEVFGHVIDCERVFSYRALRIARNDRTPLAGFEQDDYVANGNFDHRRMIDLVAEYEHVRKVSLDLFGFLSEEAWGRRGVANNVEVSVRAIAWIIAGHELHHNQIVRTKYL